MPEVIYYMAQFISFDDGLSYIKTDKIDYFEWEKRDGGGKVRSRAAEQFSALPVDRAAMERFDQMDLERRSAELK
jgi:hypothetical protein